MIVQTTGSLGMNVGQMVRMLSKAYISLVKSLTPFKSFPSVMLWGPPGVGKSQGIRQVAAEISEKTGKNVNITDVRLLLFNPVDLRGIPTASEDKTLAVWLKPKIFQMDDSSEVVNILFLDEISAAPQSVQAAAYQITLDRTVGEHKLPDNCIVIAAGNRVTDRSVAYTMPKALANRLCHIEITSDNKSWHDWAVSAGVNSMVLGFLDCNPSMLMKFDATTDSLAFPTPRSWEMVSNILNHVSEDIADVFPLVAGCVGDAAAYELRNWSEVYQKTPDIKDIFNGSAIGIPVRPEILFALASKISAYARGHHIPVILATKRIASGGKHRGGVSSYEKISKELKLLCHDSSAYVTSLLDFFALPEDTPGFSAEAPSLYEHIEMIEQAINQDIGKANCHANLLVHEFEGLLFSAPEEFALIADQNAVDTLCAVREEYPNPEEINSSFDTAPSKRILAVIPEYKKVADGSDLSQVIGIDRMMASCPHFAAWIQKIRE